MLQVKHEQANVQYRKNRLFLETLQTKTQLYKMHYFLTGSIGELLIASPHSMTVDQKVDKTWPHKHKTETKTQLVSQALIVCSWQWSHALTWKIESWTINVSSQTYKGRKSFKKTHVLFKRPTEVLVKYLSLGSTGSNFGQKDNKKASTSNIVYLLNCLWQSTEFNGKVFLIRYLFHQWLIDHVPKTLYPNPFMGGEYIILDEMDRRDLQLFGNAFLSAFINRKQMIIRPAPGCKHIRKAF